MKMKKVYLLIVICIVGLVMPQSIFADAVTYTYANLTITIDGGTVTINSSKAGALEKAIKPDNTEVINAIAGATDKIVFVGKFNEQDLKKLQKTDGPEQGRYNCCTQKTVDMSEAKFVKNAGPGQNKYNLYHDKDNLPATSENNKKYLADGSLWKSKEEKRWVQTDQNPPNNNFQNSDGWTVSNINTDHIDDYDDQPNPFVRIVTEAHYYQLIDNSTWETDEPNYGDVKDASYMNGPGSYDGQQIRVIDHYNYYRLVVGENNTRSWQDASADDGEFMFSDVDDRYKDDKLSQYGEGNLVAFPTYNYFKFHASKTWIPVNETDVLAGTYVEEPTWAENERENQVNNYNLLTYIRFVISYANYKKEKTGTFTWVQEEYNDGQEKDIEYFFSSVEAMTAPTENNKYAYVDGHEYIYDGTNWEVASGDTDEPDYSKMKFDYWKETVEEIITSKYATGPMAEQLCSDCTKLETLTLNAGDFALGHTVLGNHINSLETVNINEDVTTLSAGMFNGISTLKTVNFDDDCKITVLPNAVFRETGITSLVIPSSIELIESEAFHTCQSLETVTFVNTNPNPLVIKNNAFQQSDHIKDIYLNVNPAERKLICEYNAFDYHSMEGQTAEGSEMATLHFAEENFDYYAGAWKKGMAFDQSGLNGIKDGVSNAGGNYIEAPTQSEGAITGGYSQIDNNSDGFYHPDNYPNTKYAPANGWQQFATTASPREVVFKGYVYMTYSTDKACSLPKGLIPFRVTDYVQAGTDPVSGKTINGRLVLKMIDQVPTETGVLLISTDQYVVTDETSISKIYLGDPIGTPTPFPHEEIDTDKLNYLVPAVSGVKVGPVSKGPYSGNNSFELKGTSDFDHRNFIMRKDTHQFVRTQKGTMANNRAFLSLPITKFTNDNEKATEGPNPWNTKAGDAFNTYDETSTDPDSNTGNAKTTLFFEYDVEKYGMIWPLAQKEDVTDGIDEVVSNSNAERVQQGIFTLQGVKVDTPTTKGIYIVNGKKVIIK